MFNSATQIRKLDRFDYFYFFIVVIYAAMAVPATKSMVRPQGGGAVAFIIPWGLTIFMAFRHRVRFDNMNLIKVLFIYFAWVLLQTIKYEHFYDGVFLYFLNILIAYMLIRIFDVKMFALYEQVVVMLSVFAIIGWLFQVLTPGPFSAFMKATSVHNFAPGNTIIANNIVFSLSDYVRNTLEGYALARNSGFSWEPGRYASMVIFALFFNMIRLRFNLKKNVNFWILFIALFTSQSTTGYVALLFLMFLVVISKFTKYKALVLSYIFVPLVFLVISLPFISGKISKLWFNENNVNQIVASSQWNEKMNQNGAIVPQRFSAMILEVVNFKHDPLIGYGIAPSNSYVQTHLSKLIWLPGGTLQVFSQFGLFIGILAYLCLFRSSKFYARLYGVKGDWYFFIIFILLSTSYTFWDVPFFMSAWMFSVFKTGSETINLSREVC